MLMAAPVHRAVHWSVPAVANAAYAMPGTVKTAADVTTAISIVVVYRDAQIDSTSNP